MVSHITSFHSRMNAPVPQAAAKQGASRGTAGPSPFCLPRGFLASRQLACHQCRQALEH